MADEDTGTRTHMRTVSAHVFTCAPGTVRHFRLIADRTPTGRLGISSLHWVQTRAGYSLNYALTKDAAVSAEILTLTGTVLNTLMQGEHRSAGENSFFWDGRDARGSFLPAGTYLCELTAETEEGERVQAVTAILMKR